MKILSLVLLLIGILLSPILMIHNVAAQSHQQQQQQTCSDGSQPDSNGNCPSTPSQQQQQQQTCSDGSQPDSNGNCPSTPSQQQQQQPPYSQGSGLDYSTICQTLQPVLLQQCDTLVNSDGSLTPDGTHAVQCIQNCILLAGGATFLHLPLPLIVKGLSILSTPTGCNGIVDMTKFDLLSHIGSLGSILTLLS